MPQLARHFNVMFGSELLCMYLQIKLFKNTSIIQSIGIHDPTFFVKPIKYIWEKSFRQKDNNLGFLT